MSPRKRQVYSSSPASKPPTIREVAEHAGVSTATVSRVLSDQLVVSEDLAKKVRDAVTALEYRPNRTTRGLRKRPVQMVGLIVPDIQNSFFASVIGGIEPVLEASGYNLLLCNSGEDPHREMVFLTTLRAEGVAGIILAPSRGSSDELRQFVRIGPPVVSVETAVERAMADTVRMNTASGVAAAVEHLVAQGRRRIGFIGGPEFSTSTLEARKGYRQALSNSGIPVEENLIRTGDSQLSGGYRAMRELLDLPQAPTAVLVANSQMVVGAMQAIRERGLSIPEQIALIGFDDPFWAAFLQPSLTTVAQSGGSLGAEAARLLLERIAQPRLPAREVVLETELIVRESSG
jgi:DNA-binding LacI/PurR family transcriptional regulator